MDISIVSWNIAAARRDDKNGNSLANRMGLVIARLTDVQQAHHAQIVVLQELRPTEHTRLPGMKWSAAEVAENVRKALGPHWNVYLQRVNASRGAFYRATLWDSRVLMAVGHNVGYTSSSDSSSAYYFMQLTSSFVPVDSDLQKVTHPLHVVNMQAPVAPLEAKQLYWTTAAENVDQDTIGLGDMNKFGEQLEAYTDCLQGQHVVDHMHETTFLSFDYDTQPDGTLYRSCLDAVLLHKDTNLQNLQMAVESTETARASDHFLVCARFMHTF